MIRLVPEPLWERRTRKNAHTNTPARMMPAEIQVLVRLHQLSGGRVTAVSTPADCRGRSTVAGVGFGLAALPEAGVALAVAEDKSAGLLGDASVACGRGAEAVLGCGGV